MLNSYDTADGQLADLNIASLPTETLLSDFRPHLENRDAVAPVVMAAYGGQGIINTRFFHTAYSRFEGAAEPKVTDLNGNWEFFAYAVYTEKCAEYGLRTY